MSVGIFHVNIAVHYMHVWCPQRPEDIRFPAVTDGCELPVRALEMEPESSGRTSCALNSRLITPAPSIHAFF